MKRGWTALATIPLIVVGFAFMMMEIWTDVDGGKFGDTAKALLIPSFLAWIGIGFACIGEPSMTLPWSNRQPRLDRAGRKALKVERQRLALDRRIAELEEENRS